MSEASPTVLLVDDDQAFRERMARALRERGYEVRTAPDAESAAQLAEGESPEFAVLDLRMPGETGLWLLQRLRELDATTQIFILTGYGSIPTAVEATRLGAAGYLQKPVDAEEVVRALRGEQSPVEVKPATLARAEWEHIHRILADCKGNISEAARQLGLHRRSLQRKLQKYPPTR